MKVKDSRGFTLVEIIVSLIIMAILAGIIAPSVANYTNQSRITNNNNTARTIFLAVQSQLTGMKNSGTLTRLAEFSREGGKLVIKGGYLKTTHPTAGLVDATKENIYYLFLSKSPSKPDDPFLLELLEKLDMAGDVINASVCIEVNAATGNVVSAFYSKDFDTFVYDSSANLYNLKKNREANGQLGVYTVDVAGFADIGVSLEPSIVLTDGLHEDGTGIENALYCEAYIIDDSAMHTIEICDQNGVPYLDGDGRPYAISFTGKSILQTSFNSNPIFQYRDLQAADHAGSIIDGAKEDIHIVHRSSGLVSPDGGTVMTHRKVVWVLDLLDDNNSEVTFKNSIYTKYPGIKIEDITARMRYAGSESGFSSDVVNAYYAFETNDAYIISDARHFSNMRYVATNPESPIRKFIQSKDIDMSVVQKFVPLNWVPSGDGGATSGSFEANFIGEKNATSSYLISNVNIRSNAPDTGIFGVIENSSFKGIVIENATIEAQSGGNVGAIAGSVINSTISRAAVSANITVSGGGAANVGGLVGLLEESHINFSYNSGGVSTEETFGAVNISGVYSMAANVGGIAGRVLSGSVSTSYNNARVGIKSVSSGSTYQIEDPKYDTISALDLKAISIGGVVGRNDGVVQNCYATNFSAEYYTALGESNSGSIVGMNQGTCRDSYALYNGVPYDTLGDGVSNGRILNKAGLKGAASLLGTSWFKAGNTTASEGVSYHLAANYPYPVISNNAHRFDWENIDSPIDAVALKEVNFENALGLVPAMESDEYPGYIEVNISNSMAANYIGNLRIDVKYRGVSPLFTRVELDSFRVDWTTGQHIDGPWHEDLRYGPQYVPFSVRNQPAWFSNFATDQSFYYATALRPLSATVYSTLPFVRGVQPGFIPTSADYTMYIKIEVSGADPVGYGSLWDIDQLPWR